MTWKRTWLPLMKAPCTWLSGFHMSVTALLATVHSTQRMHTMPWVRPRRRMSS